MRRIGKRNRVVSIRNNRSIKRRPISASANRVICATTALEFKRDLSRRFPDGSNEDDLRKFLTDSGFSKSSSKRFMKPTGGYEIMEMWDMYDAKELESGDYWVRFTYDKNGVYDIEVIEVQDDFTGKRIQEYDVEASTRTRKRSIKASASSIRTEFQKFISELEADIQDNERDLSNCTRLQGSYMSDSDGGIFDITPVCYGVYADDLDTLCIEYDSKTGEYTAYCAGNDDVVTTGTSFNDIQFDCYIWLKDTLIQMYEEIDGESDV